MRMQSLGSPMAPSFDFCSIESIREMRAAVDMCLPKNYDEVLIYSPLQCAEISR